MFWYYHYSHIKAGIQYPARYYEKLHVLFQSVQYRQAPNFHFWIFRDTHICTLRQLSVKKFHSAPNNCPWHLWQNNSCVILSGIQNNSWKKEVRCYLLPTFWSARSACRNNPCMLSLCACRHWLRSVPPHLLYTRKDNTGLWYPWLHSNNARSLDPASRYNSLLW